MITTHNIKTPVKLAHGFVDLGNKILLHYVETGETKGWPVIFIHGFPDSWNSFRLVLEDLSPEFHSFSIDLRGFGESSKPESGYSIEHFADDVVAFLDALGIEQASIVGHSMGSFVAQSVALRYPDRVIRLVLIGSASKVSGNLVISEVLDAVNTLQDPIGINFISDFQSGTSYGKVDPDFFESIIQESLRAPAHVWKESLKKLSEYDHSKHLNNIKHKTMIAWGGHDTIFSRAEQLALFKAIPNAVLKIYEDAGHSLNWEQSELFSGELKAFLNS